MTTRVYAINNTHFALNTDSDHLSLPLSVKIVIIVSCLGVSGLFSGLNLGLMALDINELKVIERCGTAKEREYARRIRPIRRRANYLLCTLLFGNVLVNTTLTIFLDQLFSGVMAVILSTLSIVIFGEIVPQAFCSRHGLAVAARTAWITEFFMVVTFIPSWITSKFLNLILGQEIGKGYDRERLMEYIRVTKEYNRLEADEVNIISGALKLSKITVIEIMTPLKDVFMLPNDSILSTDIVNTINEHGYSRIPIYEKNLQNIVGILHAKDLAFADTEANVTIETFIEKHTDYSIYQVFEDVTLDLMLNELKKGKSHMAFVLKIDPPIHELVGVVTLEDVIEELIQAEINDETDIVSDNRRKKRRRKLRIQNTKIVKTANVETQNVVQTSNVETQTDD